MKLVLMESVDIDGKSIVHETFEPGTEPADAKYLATCEVEFVPCPSAPDVNDARLVDVLDKTDDVTDEFIRDYFLVE